MKFHKQLFLHDPENGVWGDCYRTCIACILNLNSPEEVPHENRDVTDVEQWELIDNWLRPRGLLRITIPINGDAGVEAALASGTYWVRNAVPFIFSGASRRGTCHAVVAQDGRIVHDPAWYDASVVGPERSGFMWVEYFVRLP